MYMNDIKRNMQYTYDYLDTINIKPLLNAYDNAQDIANELNLTYNYEICNDPILQGSILNQIDVEEFACYLNKRYGCNFHEETVWVK